MAQVRAKGVQSYGVAPARTIAENTSRISAHGGNKRVAEHAFVDRVRYPLRVVIKMAAAKG
jgi:hypothetical protein